MGLDMYLHKLPKGDKEQSYEVCYWRKANAIHHYFTKDAEEDNCVEFTVNVDDLTTLKNMCLKSLKNKEPLLETASGFFWGGTDYDDYYWDMLSSTADDIEVILSHHTEGDTYEYYAWY